MTSIDFQAVASRYLLPYQQSWLADESRFKIGMWARQTGKSFATACEASVDCVRRPGQHWVVLSAGERQALEWMQKARFWVGVLGKIARFSEPEYVRQVYAGAACLPDHPSGRSCRNSRSSLCSCPYPVPLQKKHLFYPEIREVFVSIHESWFCPLEIPLFRFFCLDGLL